MPEETVDPGLLEQTKNQIRKLVAEIADLAESDIQPSEFYVEFLNRVDRRRGGVGRGALAAGRPKGNLKLQHQLEFRLTGLMDGRARTQPHDALLGCMIQASQPQIIPPGAAVEGVPNAGNPTNYSLIIAPMTVDKQVVGLVEILMDPTRRAATQKSTLRFVSDLCDLAGTYLKNRQMRQMMSQQRLWNQLEGFTHQIHASLDLKETAYAVANDGKRLIGCDRLSVAMKIGGRVMRPGGQRPGGRRAAGQPDPRADAGSARSRSARARTSSTPATPRGSPPTSATRWRSTSTSRARSPSSSRSCTSPRPSRTRTGSPSAAWSPSRSATSWPRPTCTRGPRSSRGTPRRRSGTRRSTTRSSCCRCSS